MTPLRLVLASLAGGLAILPAAGAARAEPNLAFPLACTIGRTCEVQSYVDRDPGPGIRDYRCGARTYDKHGGVDIRIADMAAQRAGVDVLAAAAGRVVRLRDGVTDISIRAPGAPSVAGQECGNAVVLDHGDGWETQYCHLAKGSVRVKIGDQVKAGQPLAQVGLSGDTEFPHLHITVRHAGRMVDPFAPAMADGACDAGGSASTSLWTPAAAQAMSYKRGAVLNAGFAGAPAQAEAIEAGRLDPAGPAAPLLVAYVRVINLELGDVQELVLKDPKGAVVAQSKLPPLDHGKAQYVFYVGHKRPAGGWPSGTYKATYTVTRAGGVALTRVFTTRF